MPLSFIVVYEKVYRSRVATGVVVETQRQPWCGTLYCTPLPASEERIWGSSTLVSLFEPQSTVPRSPLQAEKRSSVLHGSCIYMDMENELRAIAHPQDPRDDTPTTSRGQHPRSAHPSQLAASPSRLGPGISPSSTAYSTFDEFANDPRFLESQQEFRSLLLNSAQSAAPTRQGSPVLDAFLDNQSGDALSSIVTDGHRLVWLQNYLDEVAPWVRLCRRIPLPSLMRSIA